MKYFVIWPDGQRFGPVDIPTLQQWQTERRIDSETILEEERSQQRVRAALVLGSPQGFAPPTVTSTPFSNPSQPPFSGYPRGVQIPQPQSAANGKTELTLSWIFGAASIPLACCIPFILPIIGLVLGFVAKNKGQAAAAGAIALNIVGIVVQFGLLLFGGLGALLD